VEARAAVVVAVTSTTQPAEQDFPAKGSTVAQRLPAVAVGPVVVVALQQMAATAQLARVALVEQVPLIASQGHRLHMRAAVAVGSIPARHLGALGALVVAVLVVEHLPPRGQPVPPILVVAVVVAVVARVPAPPEAPVS
jgi:hypothetical protein